MEKLGNYGTVQRRGIRGNLTPEMKAKQDVLVSWWGDCKESAYAELYEHAHRLLRTDMSAHYYTFYQYCKAVSLAYVTLILRLGVLTMQQNCFSHPLISLIFKIGNSAPPI